MKNVIKKLLSIVMIFLVFNGCSYKSNTETSIESDKNILYDESNNTKVRKDTYIELEHSDNLSISMDECDLRTLTIKEGNIISSVKSISDKYIIESYPKYPKDNQNSMELGVLDAISSVYKTIEIIPFSAAYENHSIVIQNRYYVMIYSIDNGQRIQGNVLIYDLYNGILQNIDNYDVFNIVQYIIPVGSDGFAYFYYEAETQDWILKYKDLDEENPIEIFRHSNNNDMITSPVSLTCEGNNIILALQYVKNEVYYTQLIELYSQGEILETENLELSPMFGDKYEITDFKIQDDIYYIKTFADNSEKYFLFKKADNNLSIIFPAICNLNYIMENIEESKTDVLFKQDEPVLGAFINVNIKNNAIISYNIDNVFLYDNNLELNFSECSDTDNILLVYQTDAGSYKYQLINDYKSIKTKVNNYALFEFPKDKSDLVKGDVRWKYIFS